jgi:hypothetical protein
MDINIGEPCKHWPERSIKMSRIFINTKDKFSYFATFWHKSDNIAIEKQKQ